ncbi:MAG: 6-bladed beta-propeller [Elusimicrobia bacterium]|nr:6-bladed beta-propeller [Elusimicrobiota bacterium]
MRSIVLSLAVMGGLFAVYGTPAAAAAEAKEIVFPAPPDVPRIKYLRSLARESDISGRKSGMWGKFLNAITGKEASNIFMTRPYDVCADTGSVYVSDSEGGAVVAFNLQSGKAYKIGGTLEGRLVSPMGVALDSSGRLFVADSAGDTIKVFSVNGDFLFRFGLSGSGPGQLKKPLDVTYDRGRDRILVADSGNARIQIFDTAGKFIAQIGSRGTADGQFSIPVGVAVAPDGRVIVSDTMLCRVQEFSPDGKFLLKFGEQGDSLGYFARPKGVATDSDGNIYVADALFSAIQIFDPKGELLMHFGAEGGEPGAFQLPIGVYVDDQDKVYIADSFNQRVQVFQYLKQPKAP